MAYERQNFKNGQTLTADHLNHIEDGIVNVGGDGSGTSSTVSMTAKDYGYDMNLMHEGTIESYPLFLLPEVTVANNGSFLRVVDGKWAIADAPASALPSAEEVAF